MIETRIVMFRQLFQKTAIDLGGTLYSVTYEPEKDRFTLIAMVAQEFPANLLVESMDEIVVYDDGLTEVRNRTDICLGEEEQEVNILELLPLTQKLHLLQGSGSSSQTHLV